MKNLSKLPNSSRIGTFWGQKRDSNVISWIQKALVELRRYKIGETRIKFFSISDFVPTNKDRIQEPRSLFLPSA